MAGMEFSEIRIRRGNPSFGNCKKCGAPGNRCFDYCPRFNVEMTEVAANWDDVTNEELELTPYDKPYRLENWDKDDLITYVGGIYAKEAFAK